MSDEAADQGNLGIQLQEAGRLEEALVASRRAVELRPDWPEAHNNLGNVYLKLGRLDEAALAYREAIRRRPAYPQALSNLGLALATVGRLEDAVTLYSHAIAADPAWPDAYHNLANTLTDLGRTGEALAAYRQAVALKPDFAEALAALVHLQRHACDWDELAADERALLGAVRAGGARIAPLILMSLAGATAADHLAAARAWAAPFAVPAESRLPPPPASVAGRRIRLGYLSADFHAHATATLTAELFEHHDRGRFEVFGYSLGPDDGSAMRRRLEAGFDHFIDLRNAAHFEAARRIRADGIDILVDLKGYTQNARPRILAYRPAPIQINWLGYPGSMGADFIDAILVDSVVAPAEDQQFYDERLIALPDCYQPNDSQRPIAAPPSRQACGLPEHGLVFCCFNNTFKLNPDFFDLWARLLAKVPGSVLWLLGANELVEANLRHQAAARGLDPDRLVFAPRLPLAEHLARYRIADLFLDVLPYNAHTTASDALWAGLPVLTVRGASFAGRVAASLLSAVGLPELIAETMAEYEVLALALAADSERRAALRHRLGQVRATAPLFDSRRFTAAIEAAFSGLWANRCDKAGLDSRPECPIRD